MKIKYEQIKSRRIKKGTYRHNGKRWNMFIGFEALGYWWYQKENRWVSSDEFFENDLIYSGDVSTCNHKVKSLKSAISHIKRHNYMPKGVIFRLSCRFVGHNIEIIK